MNQPIIQKLGFDASGAIRSLNSLATSLENVNNKIILLNRVTAGDPLRKLIGSQAAELNRTLRGLSGEVNRLKTSVGTLGQQGTRDVDSLRFSFDNVGKLLAANLISRGISAITSQLLDAAESAREFELAIARTQVIGNDGDTISGLSSQARQLAIDLGRPLAEVASATFETLQNDVGNTAESFVFLRSAGQLATVQGSALEDAMNSITSVMKVFGEEAGSAADISDTFFVAVDKGRLTLAELTDRLGTINPLANELGVSFTEVAAASASLTQTGLNTATATTQLRNVLTKLIRPTDALKEAFRGLGVASGADLIAQQGGLIKALQALQGQFNGSGAAAANAFGTIRGQLGVLNLLSGEAKLATDILAAFDDQAGKLAEAFDTVEQTKARQYEKELAKLNDTLLDLSLTAQDVQLNLTSLLNDVIELAGGGKSALAGLAVVAVASFASMRAAAGGFNLSLLDIGKTLRGAAGFAALAALGAKIATQLQVLSRSSKDFTDEIEANFLQSQQATVTALQEAQSKSTEIYRKAVAERDVILNNSFKQAQALYLQDVQNYDDYVNRIGITANRVAEDFIKNRQDLLGQIDNFIKGIDGRIRAGTDRLQTASQRLADFRFEEQTKGLDNIQKSYAEASRAANTAAQAASAFASAGLDERRLKQAQALQTLAESQARDALNSARGTAGESQAANLVQRTLQQGVQLEQQNIERLKAFDKVRFAEQRDEIERLSILEKNKAEELALLNQRLGSDGEARDRAAFDADSKRAGQLGKELEEIRARVRGIPLIDVAGEDFRRLSDSTSAAFEQGISKARYDFSNAIQTFEQQLKNKPFSVEVDLVSRTLAATSMEGITRNLIGASPREQLAAQDDDLRSLVSQGEKAQQVIDALDSDINSEINRFRDSLRANVQALPFDQWFNIGQGFTIRDFFGLDETATRAQFTTESLKLAREAALALIQVQNSERTPADLSAAQSTLDDIRKRTEALGETGQIDANGVQALQLSLTSADNVLKLYAARANSLPSIEERQKISEADMKLRLLTQTLDGVNQRTKAVAEQFNNAARAAAAMRDAAAGATGAVPGQYFGGVVHRAFGGELTRGGDSQLIAASPGEMVVNSRDSSRFFSQLRAINAGQNPVTRDQGGNVTNVGDINVNINNTSGGVDGRQIAESLRRELRRRG